MTAPDDYRTDAGSIRLALESGHFTPEEAFEALVLTATDPNDDPTEVRPWDEGAAVWWHCFGTIVGRATAKLIPKLVAFLLELAMRRAGL